MKTREEVEHEVMQDILSYIDADGDVENGPRHGVEISDEEIAAEVDRRMLEENKHEHQWGIKISGLQKCRVEGCRAENYDSQWGAGIFNDWPTGHHKPYGS